jgi:hypothetical protein
VSRSAPLGTLATKIVALHERLDSVGIRHQFGGAIALAWYRNPRATTNIDINLTLPPTAADPVLGSIAGLGVTVSAGDRATIAADGQARLDWRGSDLDVFFTTVELHQDMAAKSRLVQFGPVTIPILAPEHLIVCKAIFDRPQDWLDIEAMVAWGTEIDVPMTLGWVNDLLGKRAQQSTRLAATLEPAP